MQNCACSGQSSPAISKVSPHCEKLFPPFIKSDRNRRWLPTILSVRLDLVCSSDICRSPPAFAKVSCMSEKAADFDQRREASGEVRPQAKFAADFLNFR